MNWFARSILSLTVFSASAVPLTAQDVLEELYGSGVHAFFAGQHDQADQHFNQAIDAGSRDPRLFYFRGLNQVRRGGGVIELGLADFEQGAQYEVEGRRSGDIARSLSRIQGRVRVELERIRTQARLSAKAEQYDLMRRRYEQAGDEGTVYPGLQEQRLGGRSPEVDATDPFAGDSDLVDGEPEVMPESIRPAPAAPVETDDAFDPFQDDEPAAPAPAPAADDADPFGDSFSDEDDPFSF